jgi:hypothetical protein
VTIIDEARRALPDIEFDLIVVESLDDVVRCNAPKCESIAVVIYVHECGSSYQSCARHKAQVDAFDAQQMKLGQPAYCIACGLPAPVPTPWVLL